MSLLWEIIERHIGEILHREGISSWDVDCRESNICTILTSRFKLTFVIDNRNRQVTSTIQYNNIVDKFSDEISIRVALGMFPDVVYSDGLDVDDISKRVVIELENVSAFLMNMRENDFTHRDLFFFSDGYNAGYTYVYSRDSG